MAFQKLKHGAFLTKKNFPQFVEQFNEMVDFCRNLRGDADTPNDSGSIKLDRSVKGHPVIRADARKFLVNPKETLKPFKVVADFWTGLGYAIYLPYGCLTIGGVVYDAEQHLSPVSELPGFYDITEWFNTSQSGEMLNAYICIYSDGDVRFGNYIYETNTSYLVRAIPIYQYKVTYDDEDKPIFESNQLAFDKVSIPAPRPFDISPDPNYLDSEHFKDTHYLIRRGSYMVGGVVYETNDDLAIDTSDSDNTFYAALKIDISSDIPRTTFEKYSTLRELKDVQVNKSTYIIPLYYFKNGTVAMDLRGAPAASMGEFL